MLKDGKAQVKLSDVDRVVLNSYVDVVQCLGAYLPKAYELVLHSLEDLDHSVICIVNGQHTGRKVGASITDVALKMLTEIDKNQTDHMVYFSRNSKNEPLKSTTIAIRGEQNRIIGLLCINLYLGARIDDFLSSFIPEGTKISKFLNEDYASTENDLIKKSYLKIRGDVIANNKILPSNKNKVIIERLYDEGIFNLKNAVEEVSKIMGISKNTVYMHVRNYKNVK